MGSLTPESLTRFLENHVDERHGTYTGYLYGCRCARCKAAYRANQNARRQRERERRAEEKAAREAKLSAKPKPAPRPTKAGKRPSKDVCTVPEFLKPLMGKPSVSNAEGRCCWCGAPATNHHHVVKRSAGKWVVDGREKRKPTVLLCGSGNASGCHGKAHQGRLHFRFVEHEPNMRNRPMDCDIWHGAGHWEGIETEPMSQFDAMQIDTGWRRLR